ncbi:hypothetical protein ACFY1L_55270 [Streptomyces sp. NPDC001663]|uniref:hypothetical protein n=1 Tax=Streptomyces sp. NPDC001663 TaxID=3364597 RepID=UPI0036BD5603
MDDPAASWSLDDPRLRSQAVKASVEAATTLLPPGGAERFTELGIFAEDELIPVSAVTLLWEATGGLAEAQTRSLCQDLARLSLLTLDPRHGGQIGIHDVIRDYLRGGLGTAGLARLNSQLVDVIAATLPPTRPLTPTAPDPQRAWWQLQDGYLLDHLITHLITAGRTVSAEATAGDVRWVEARLTQRGPSAPWNDLARINTPHSRSLALSISQIAHLLIPTDPPHALTGVLHNRLEAHPHWHPQITARRQDPALRPCLVNRWPLPDGPNTALQRMLTRHAPGVSGGNRSVAIAPDGTWLATTGSADGGRIWDRASGTCTATLAAHTGWGPVAIAPDGTWLATGSHDGKVRIWDPASQTCTATLTAHTDAVWSMAIAPDGTWLATGGRDGNVRIWDRASQTCTATLTSHTDAVLAMAIAPDGTWLATGGRDGNVRIWDRASQTCTATLTAHTGWVLSVAIATDGTWLATSGHDKAVRIWDRTPGTCIATLTGHSKPVASVAIAPDGTWLATGDGDGKVRIWDRASQTCTATLTGHTEHVQSVAIAPDGTWLATASAEAVRTWDQEFAAQVPSPGPTDCVMSVAIAPGGTWLATGGRDGRQSTLIATEGRNGTARIWDRASGTCSATLTSDSDTVWSVAIAPDATWLATGSFKGTVQIWDRASGTCTATLPRHTGWGPVAIAPDGTWLATGEGDGKVRIWDRASGACIATLTGHTDAVRSVAIAPDGTWLATGGQDGKVRIWERTSGTCTSTLTGDTEAVHSVAIAPDGSWLATGGNDQTVRIWDRISGTCTAALTGHTDAVRSVAIAPDGTWLATIGNDRTVRIWEIAGARTVAIAHSEGTLYSCAWADGSHELAVGGERGVYLFALLT